MQQTIQQRETPVWIEKEITRCGGHIDGKPKYRVVWGGSFVRANTEGIIERPYQVDRWHMEKLINGEYEHCWKLSDCPHRGHDQPWCKDCFKSGGEAVTLEPSGWRIFERAIQLIQLSENLQNKALQKNALMEREQAKEEKRGELIRDMVHDTAPVRTKRTQDVPLHVSADEAHGRRLGIRQIN